MYQPEARLRRRRFSRRLTVYFSFLILGWVFIGLFSLLLYSPLLRIKKIKIEGNRRLGGAEIISLARAGVLKDGWRRLLGASHWLSWLEPVLISKNKLLARLEIHKDWWRGELALKVEERQALAVWCESDECSAVDEEGTTFERVGPDELPGGLSLIYANGRIDDQKEFWPNLKKILVALRSQGSGRYEVDFELQEVKTQLKNGPETFFSLRFEPAVSLSALEKLKTRPEFQKWQYLDFRVENRAYYR